LGFSPKRFVVGLQPKKAQKTTLYAGTDSHDNNVTQPRATVNGLEKIFATGKPISARQMPVGQAQPEEAEAEPFFRHSQPEAGNEKSQMPVGKAQPEEAEAEPTFRHSQPEAGNEK
jgi:hypothetical protein